MTTPDIEATKLANAMMDHSYNSIARPLQATFIEVAKFVTNEQEAIALIAAAGIILQEAIAIAARQHSPDARRQLLRGGFYMKDIFTQVSKDTIEDIVTERPIPSLLRPK